MPSVDNVLGVATHSSWFGDMYAVDMFHNYKMLESLQLYAGIDVSLVEKGDALYWEIWTRMNMGLVSSPFATTRIFSWAMEVITGYRKRSSNTFSWGVIIQHPPGTTSYDPTMTRLYRWDSIREVISTDSKTYVYVLRYIVATH